MKRLALLIAQFAITVLCSKCYSCMPRKGDEIENLRYYYPVGNDSHIIGSTAAEGNYFGFALIGLVKALDKCSNLENRASFPPTRPFASIRNSRQESDPNSRKALLISK